MDALEHLETVVSDLAKLPRGWDSYDAEPIDETSIENAQQLIRAMLARGFAPVQIWPEQTGTVAMRWKSGFSEADVEATAEAGKYAGCWEWPSGEMRDFEYGNVEELAIDIRNFIEGA